MYVYAWVCVCVCVFVRARVSASVCVASLTAMLCLMPSKLFNFRYSSPTRPHAAATDIPRERGEKG